MEQEHGTDHHGGPRGGGRALAGTSGGEARQAREDADMEMLWGYGQTQWRSRDVSLDGLLWGWAIASAPPAKGYWPADDGDEFKKEWLRLLVEFRCYGHGAPVPRSTLSVMWIEDGTIRGGARGFLAASDPPLAWSSWKQARGRSMLASWDVQIGGAGGWQTRDWEAGRPDMV